MSINLDALLSVLVNEAVMELHPQKPFMPNVSPVPVSGKVFGKEELFAATRASLEFWLTAGPHTEEFERLLAKVVSTRHGLMVNSGSSANLLALTSLTSPKLGNRKLVPGDEVITVAAGFPTTVTPILQNGLIPVYVDVDPDTYVAIEEQIIEAISPRTKAIMMAHTLGNPFNLNFISELCKRENIWLIEDACDALGGTYDNKPLGSFGDISTLSFYPAHHITTGEGGAVLTKKSDLKKIIESFRDWGRDCWCASGCDNTCFKRYGWKLGDLPDGYDHKYTYSHLGFNLKSGDIQAAIGIAQLERLSSFVELRRRNWAYLLNGLQPFSEFLLLPKPTPLSDPSWFGFAITVKENSPVSRNEIVAKLNNLKIGTRLIFGGNLLKQPAFIETPRRIVGELINTDNVMLNSFWIGVWPGLTLEMLDYVIESFELIFNEYK